MNDDPITIFRRLAVKQHVLLGGLTGARSCEFDVALAAAATTLPEGATMTEPEVNEALKAWLAGPGSMLDTDHVELRRWLVDAGFVSRDGFGRAYVRGEAEAARATALLGEGPAAALEDAVLTQRAARAAERASRRQAYTTR